MKKLILIICITLSPDLMAMADWSPSTHPEDSESLMLRRRSLLRSAIQRRLDAGATNAQLDERLSELDGDEAWDSHMDRAVRWKPETPLLELADDPEQADLVEELVRRGARADVQSSGILKITPLEKACEAYNMRTVHILLPVTSPFIVHKALTKLVNSLRNSTQITERDADLFTALLTQACAHQTEECRVSPTITDLLIETHNDLKVSFIPGPCSSVRENLVSKRASQEALRRMVDVAWAKGLKSRLSLVHRGSSSYGWPSS